MDAFDESRLRGALSRLHVEVERTWRQRCCLPSTRVWKVALQIDAYEPAELEHLASCAACQQRHTDVLAEACPVNVPQTAITSVQQVKIGVRSAQKDPAGSRFTFAGDLYLSAKLTESDHSELHLEITHQRWNAPMLLRVTVGSRADEVAWRWFMPSSVERGVFSARAPVNREKLINVKGLLSVQPVNAGDLTSEDLPTLREAVSAASGDTVLLVSWQTWSKRALRESDKLVAPVREYLQTLGGFPTQPAPQRSRLDR